MVKKAKKRRAWTTTEIRELKSLAKKKTAAAKVAKKLRTQSGGRVLTSPARSSTTLSDWARAFSHE
jgi:hypothetical protein